jgi:spore germination protein YaaH
MRFPIAAGLVVGALLAGTQVALAGASQPAPSPDSTHPVSMQQASAAMAAAPVNTTQPAGIAPASAGAAQTASNLHREVFGFALASSLADPTVGYPSWNFSLLSTVAFFGLHINDDGTIASDAGLTTWNSSSLTNLVTIAHASGTKVVVTIIEQDFASGTPHMCAALANRATVVSQTVAQVSAKGVDGVNIDFEGLNGTCPNGQTARSMMSDLATQLRAALPTGSYLSVDTYASSASDSLGFFDVPGLNASVDSFFVMAYDLEYSNYSRPPTSCATFCLGPTAPLAGYYYNDTTTAAQYSSAVGASKVILGVPYYGRKSCVSAATPNATPTGTVTADTYLSASTETSSSEVQAGTYAIHHDANDPSGQERWDTWYNTTLNCTRELYWDDAISLGLKYDLVNNDGLRGVGIWNLNYGGGASELWDELAGHFERCTSAGLSASLTSPQVAGPSVQFTATSGGCTSPEYEFWLQTPGSSAWQSVQPYSTSATFNWTTSGTVAGTYHVGVWARSSTVAAYDAVASTAFTITPAVCTGVTESASPPSPALSGTPVTITAVASGCPSPLYEFWMMPQGSTWRIIQGYASNASYRWNSTGALAGTEQFGVWVRDASSSASYDAYTGIPYSVTTASCASVTVSAAPVTVAHGSGTHVTITAAASGCTNANPRYEFWMRAASQSSWQLVQGYSANATYDWNSTGAAAGTVYFGVWAKDTSSPTSSYDANASTPVSVT